jgi:hypothetical protein
MSLQSVFNRLLILLTLRFQPAEFNSAPQELQNNALGHISKDESRRTSYLIFQPKSGDPRFVEPRSAAHCKATLTVANPPAQPAGRRA